MIDMQTHVEKLTDICSKSGVILKRNDTITHNLHQFHKSFEIVF